MCATPARGSHMWCVMCDVCYTSQRIPHVMRDVWCVLHQPEDPTCDLCATHTSSTANQGGTEWRQSPLCATPWTRTAPCVPLTAHGAIHMAMMAHSGVSVHVHSIRCSWWFGSSRSPMNAEPTCENHILTMRSLQQRMAFPLAFPYGPEDRKKKGASIVQ